jgi:hypothetical protein
MSDETAPALKLEVDAIESIPEPIRPLYQQAEGGKFRLRVEGVEDVGGLKSALQKEREARKAAEKANGKWQSLGIDPDEVGKVLTERQAAEQERLKKSGDYDALLRQTTERYEKTLAEARAELDAERKAAEKAIVGSAISQALNSLGALPEGADLLSLKLQGRIRTELESGTRVTRVLTEDGEIMAGPNGKHATVEDLVKSVREQYPMLFRASGASGGGKPQGSGVSATQGLSRSQLTKNPVEKARFLEQYGQEAYFKLPA